MSRQLRLTVQFVVFLAALVSIGLMLTVGYLEGAFGRVLGLILAVWVAAPYVVLFRAAAQRGADSTHGWALLVAGLVLAASGIAVYYHARFVDTEPHSGVDFFIVPAWQLVAAAFVAWSLHRRLSRRGEGVRRTT